jgi:arylformamidase
MSNSASPIVYRGMTANQVAEGFDDSLTIPNLLSLLQENRDRAAVVKDKLKPLHDVAYGDEPLQKLDIYAPKNAKDLPVLIDVHGGGWIWGSKNPRSIPAESIMSEGVIWVPIDYGMAPQYNMESMVSHVHAAIAWVYQNIAQYGGNPNRIFITGQSSGAHLAAAAIMPDWHSKFDVPENVIKGAILLSGIYDLDSLIYASKNEVQDILKITPEEARRFSPMYHLPLQTIPVIIAYGEQEPLAYVREAEDYAKELKNAGCEVSLTIVPDANHFDMINALADTNSSLFKVAIEVLS